MAKRTSIRDEKRDWSTDFADGGKEIVDLSSEISSSMREYIDYTLTNRALPYIDGLKPVHKAILWCMWQTGCKSNTVPVKSATISGNTIGRYWAHSGDAAYLAAAGMTRDKGDDTRCGACKLNLCLIDGHGSFGASFEDSPASQRYTEQRLSKNGESCVRDAENGAVFMEPTFDAKHTLPELAPVELPLLLINGSDGLAYGYNVSWLPHNPSEAIKSVIKRLDSPKCTVDDILAIMPGPDFPSGGIIVDKEGAIRQAYETGMGSLTLTSRYVITPLSRGRHAIDFYETPYGTPRSGDKSIVSGITVFAQDNPQYGITSVKNLSGGDNDCLIEVTVKSGINAQKVVDAMILPNSGCMLTQTISYRQSAVIGDFKRTDQPDATRRKDMLRLTNQKPRDIGMLEYLDAFIDFRRSCVINSCEYERQRISDRKHLIDGLLQALIDIDTVISVIRHSENKDTARTNLKRKFKLDDVQADYILAIPLSRLTRTDRIQLEGDSKSLADRISEIDTILSSERNIRKEIRRELKEMLAMQSLPRRTSIVSDGNDTTMAKADDNERTKQATHSADVILGKKPVTTKKDEAITLKATGVTDVCLDDDGQVWQEKKVSSPHIGVEIVDVNATIMLVFDDGSSLRMPAYELPSKPTTIQKRCIGIVPIDNGTEVAIVTASGRVKMLDTSTLTKTQECDVIRLDTGDKVVCARRGDDTTQFVIVTDKGQLLTFKTSSVNKQGRTSTGVTGIKLNGSHIIGASIAHPDAIVITSTSVSSKMTPLAEYPLKGRGTGGVRCQRFLKGEDTLTFAGIGTGIVALDDGNQVDVVRGKRDASGTTKKAVTSYRIA